MKMSKKELRILQWSLDLRIMQQKQMLQNISEKQLIHINKDFFTKEKERIEKAIDDTITLYNKIEEEIDTL